MKRQTYITILKLEKKYENKHESNFALKEVDACVYPAGTARLV